MDVAVVGAGRVGTAVAVRLRDAGHRIVAVSGRTQTPTRIRAFLRSVPVLQPADAARRAELTLVATPDDAIAPTCASIVDGGGVTTGGVIAHLSGGTSLDALASAEAVGATVLSVHPLQTFPDVASAIERLRGCPIAVTARTDAGAALGERLALDVGGRPFALADGSKALYHAAAVFASNYLVTIAAVAHDVGIAAGLEDPIALLAPLQATTLENIVAMGPEAALTGPAVRGDAGTIERHLEALSQTTPAAVAPYVVLARAAVDLAWRAGRLAPEARAAVGEVLDRWT
jgi:predicted short-subunit dehydrogenase-like oxidoreductase (DUF2520 family)